MRSFVMTSHIMSTCIKRPGLSYPRQSQGCSRMASTALTFGQRTGFALSTVSTRVAWLSPGDIGEYYHFVLHLRISVSYSLFSDRSVLNVPYALSQTSLEHTCTQLSFWGQDIVLRIDPPMTAACLAFLVQGDRRGENIWFFAFFSSRIQELRLGHFPYLRCCLMLLLSFLLGSITNSHLHFVLI